MQRRVQFRYSIIIIIIIIGTSEGNTRATISDTINYRVNLNTINIKSNEDNSNISK
jgi:hypothetical protein